MENFYKSQNNIILNYSQNHFLNKIIKHCFQIKNYDTILGISSKDRMDYIDRLPPTVSGQIV